MESIVQAKDRQAAEANKNASILLEELDLEKVMITFTCENTYFFPPFCFIPFSLYSILFFLFHFVAFALNYVHGFPSKFGSERIMSILNIIKRIFFVIEL